MLDLQKLEEKLDKALSLETEETLTNWLKRKAMKNEIEIGIKRDIDKNGSNWD